MGYGDGGALKLDCGDDDGAFVHDGVSDVS
jgi:hypothetical protein